MFLRRLAFWSLTICIVALLGYINYNELFEAYGSGPPYFGRTTNMDKWESPLMFLAVINGIAVLLMLAARWLLGLARRSSSAGAADGKS